MQGGYTKVLNPIAKAEIKRLNQVMGACALTAPAFTSRSPHKLSAGAFLTECAMDIMCAR